MFKWLKKKKEYLLTHENVMNSNVNILNLLLEEMVRKHRQLNGHETEQTIGDGRGPRKLACCKPWGCKELVTI